MLGYRGSAAELDANLDPPAPPLAALRADSKCQARCKAAAGGEKE